MKRTTAFSVFRNSWKNKGSAFTQKEKDKYGLRGIPPDAVETMETRLLRVSEQLGNLDLPID